MGKGRYSVTFKRPNEKFINIPSAENMDELILMAEDHIKKRKVNLTGYYLIGAHIVFFKKHF